MGTADSHVGFGTEEVGSSVLSEYGEVPKRRKSRKGENSPWGEKCRREEREDTKLFGSGQNW